jgi:hypothetical protein
LVNNHDPVEKGPEAWRVRIGKLISTPLPRILANTNDFSVGAATATGDLRRRAPRSAARPCDARKRVLTMRRTFRKHRERWTAVAIVAHKAASDAGTSARPVGDKRP